MKQLKKFAQIMKWPNLRETMECLRQKDEDFALDSISSDAFAYFSGLVLPGVSKLRCSSLRARSQEEAEPRGNILLIG